MKRLLLSSILVWMLGNMLTAQETCAIIGGTSSSNMEEVLKQFPAGSPGSAELGGGFSGCSNPPTGGGGGNRVTLNIKQFAGEGTILTVKIYKGNTVSNLKLDETYLFQQNSPELNYLFGVNSAYGIEVTYGAAGTSFEYRAYKASSTGDFTTVNILAAAPVSWIDPLTFNPKGEQLTLQWSVADQVDVAGYELEKMVPGGAFQKVSDIAYRENGAHNVNYSVSTAWPVRGTYYRIKQLDYAGTFDYSNTVFVKGSDESVQEFHMFPNPATDYVRMSVPDGIRSIDLISVSGRVVRSYAAAEVNREGMDVTAVAAGVYLVRLVGEVGNAKTQRLVVHH
ncbi:T9SS type A sorting domain-containing protein [Lewinella sp. IMCC34191]|uniref:T9SS type A sorting domain-containing protein n=1 Tax=Lewinella sp. IMCC34191 TaxID=2259172 RepID=UPI000E21DACE|nr:T9SS type A sorting domain-containing protein [Lewinella sp. IMCC34191]